LVARSRIGQLDAGGLTGAAGGEALAFLSVLVSRCGTEPCGSPQCLPMVEQGEAAHVELDHAARAFFLDHHRDWASLDALAEREPAAAGELSVREPLEHN